ncbi:MAG: hypothetical protein ACYCV4_07025 [Dermatophilaceae bacterium]
MPGAHDTAVFVDAAAREVGAQVAALATDCEVAAVVADGILSDSGNGAFGDARGRDGMTDDDSFMTKVPTVTIKIRPVTWSRCRG